ncbi:MAG: hypothetical protein ABWY16_00660 [Pedobacter sp.]|uniref:hypothetical protein n=1 Tax=Pedobacter sp. TaxID=1411316 RepID=UPI0033945777
MITSEIKVAEILPSTLDSREAATRLVSVIKEESKCNSKIEIDFTDTIFMSRSFADQFHKDLHTGEEILDLSFKNASNDILLMLTAVSTTQTQRKAVNKNYKVLNFSDIKSLEEFSFSW